MIYELAGIVGVDPGPLTLHELDKMAEGRRRHDWAQTSQILCLMAEQHRDKKKKPKPFEPDDFNPMVSKKRRKGTPITAANITDLKALVPEHRRDPHKNKRKKKRDSAAAHDNPRNPGNPRTPEGSEKNKKHGQNKGG